MTLAEYKALFENYLPYMQYNGIDPLESRSSLDSFQDWLVDVLTDDLVTLYQAKQSGFTLTEEQESELETIINRDIEDISDKLTKYAEQDHGDDPSVSVETYFEGLVNSESEYYTGVAMSWADYQEYFRTKDRESYIVQAYRQKVCGEFEPTREDAAEWYENALENDRTIYTDSPESYKTDEENYELYFGKKDGVYPVTYVPSGYSRIMQIVVAPAGSLSDEYKAKTARLDELKAMYSELAFEDALNGSDEHSGEIEAILNEYRALKEAADEEYELYVSEAREKIEKAYSELLLGKPFNDVMLRYTEDERVTGGADGEGCEAFRIKGELISLAYSGLDDWSDTVKEEFKKLEKGEFSRVFMDEDCFRIIFYAGDEKPGAVDMDDIYEEIKAVCLAEVQDSQWQELLKEWKKDAALTVDIETIRKVGEDSLKK
ncbi:MAG: hypothetical protein K6G56_06685 [Clostridiales bacterium]|nr:hypothetical protein [Clostridiales bacterium]